MSTRPVEFPTIVNQYDAFESLIALWTEDRADNELFSRRLAWDIVQERARFVPRTASW
jgi:hypothetical protein